MAFTHSNVALAEQEMIKMNHRTDPRQDLNLTRKPDRYIYVHTIASREYIVDRPPLFCKTLLRGKKDGERSTMIYRVCDPFVQPVQNTEGNNPRSELHDGLLVAYDLICPPVQTSVGCDLKERGLFLSLGETPLEAEIVGAEERMKERYRRLMSHADSLQHTNRSELEYFLMGADGQDLRLALDFFGEQREYHKTMAATKVCPNCGESIKSGVAYHKNVELGIICVLDWRKCVDAGVKSKADVPDTLRWWSDEEKRGPGRPRSSE